MLANRKLDIERKRHDGQINVSKFRQQKISNTVRKFDLVINIPEIMEVEFEDTKGLIRIRISKKNRQFNGQKKKNKRTNNDLQKHTNKIKYRVTRNPLRTGN